MVLSLFSLSAELTSAARESQIAIENAFKSILDEQYSFENFSDEKVFLEHLSAAVATDKIVVLCAEPSLYKAFKAFVINAFNLKLKPNKNIIKIINETHPDLDDEVVNEHASVPSGAVPLVSQDGIYSGFGIKAKKQLLIVLPLDDKRIDHIINVGLYPFVRENMDMSVLNSNADPLKDVKASKKTSKKTSSEPVLYDVQFVKETVKKLSKLGLTVAMANTQTIDFLSTISTTSVDLSKTVFISEYNCDKGDMSAREYVINLANGALVNSSNSVGAAITKVFSVADEEGKPQYFMYICIADKENANVAKLVAEDGETLPQLIYRSVEELFRMLSLWADTGYAMPQFTDESIVRQNKEAYDADTKINKFKVAVAALLGASAVASTIIAVTVQNIYGVM